MSVAAISVVVLVVGTVWLRRAMTDDVADGPSTTTLNNSSLSILQRPARPGDDAVWSQIEFGAQHFGTPIEREGLRHAVSAGGWDVYLAPSSTGESDYCMVAVGPPKPTEQSNLPGTSCGLLSFDDGLAATTQQREGDGRFTIIGPAPDETTSVTIDGRRATLGENAFIAQHVVDREHQSIQFTGGYGTFSEDLHFIDRQPPEAWSGSLAVFDRPAHGEDALPSVVADLGLGAIAGSMRKVLDQNGWRIFLYRPKDTAAGDYCTIVLSAGNARGFGADTSCSSLADLNGRGFDVITAPPTTKYGAAFGIVPDWVKKVTVNGERAPVADNAFIAPSVDLTRTVHFVASGARKTREFGAAPMRLPTTETVP